MFKWMKRRLSLEHEKLLYQNDMAISVNIGIFEEIGDQIALQEQNRFRKEMNQILESWRENGELVSSDDAIILLEMNKELRRIFDRSATRHVYTFDNKYQPPGGWDAYFERKKKL